MERYILLSHYSSILDMIKKILFLLVLVGGLAYCGEGEARETIIRYKDEITKSSKLVGISPRMLASIIYAEHSLNYKLGENVIDYVLAKSGYNSSVGICQVKVKTAEWITEQVKNKKSEYYLGEEIKYIFLNDENRILENLETPGKNILYAACYVAMIKHLWYAELNSPFLNDKSAGIVGTIYTLGIYRDDGSVRTPHIDAKMNEFGEKVQEFYNSYILRDIFP